MTQKALTLAALLLLASAASVQALGHGREEGLLVVANWMTGTCDEYTFSGSVGQTFTADVDHSVTRFEQEQSDFCLQVIRPNGSLACWSSSDGDSSDPFSGCPIDVSGLWRVRVVLEAQPEINSAGSISEAELDWQVAGNTALCVQSRCASPELFCETGPADSFNFYLLNASLRNKATDGSALKTAGNASKNQLLLP